MRFAESDEDREARQAARIAELEREAEVLADFAAAVGVKLNGAIEEVERLRAALDGHHAAWATKWENCSICRALAGTEAKDG